MGTRPPLPCCPSTHSAALQGEERLRALGEMCKVSLEEVKHALPRVRKDHKMMEGRSWDAQVAAVYDDETEMVSTGAKRLARRDQQAWPEGSGGLSLG